MSASSTKKGKARGARKSAEPSAASLKAIPELRPDAVFLGRGPEGMRMAQGLSRVTRRGRPRKGEQAEGTSTRTIRLPEAEWAALDWLSKERGITPHAAMREAIVHWLARAGDKLKASAKTVTYELNAEALQRPQIVLGEPKQTVPRRKRA